MWCLDPTALLLYATQTYTLGYVGGDTANRNSWALGASVILRGYLQSLISQASLLFLFCSAFFLPSLTLPSLIFPLGFCPAEGADIV